MKYLGNTILKAIFIIICFESSHQEKIYSFIPLCCEESQVFNGSHCIKTEEVFTEDFPYSFDENGLNSSITPAFIKSNLKDCSHFIDLPLQQSHSAVDGIFIFNNGSVSLRIRKGYESSFTYSNSEFCLLKYEQSIYSVRLCIDSPNVSSKDLGEKIPEANKYLDCKRNVCISKCCGKGSYVSLIHRPFKCLPFKNSQFQSFNPSFEFVNGSEIFTMDKNISYIVQFPLCKLYDIKDLHLLPNGTIFIPSTRELILRDKYCLDFFKFGDKIMERASVCSEDLQLSATEMISRTLHPVGLLISCIFLAVTFICHVIIPKLRDMQGLCFMSYVAALFIAFLLLSFNILSPEKLSRYGCLALAVLNYYSLLASFFWLNVMCFDIWKIVRGTTHAIHLSNIHGNNKRTYIAYSIYAWGSPFVASVATLTLHLLPEGSVSDDVIRPQFRKVRCWFPKDIKVLFAYFNGISSVLFLANLMFIIHTSILLYKAGVAFNCCQTRKSFIQESSNIKGNERLLLNMFWHRFCLFALMVINWSTEVLSLIPPIEMWVLTDILNTLQGLFIFILFMRSTNKRMMLLEAWKKVLITAKRKMEKKKSGQEEVQAQFLKDSETDNVILSISEAPKSD